MRAKLTLLPGDEYGRLTVRMAEQVLTGIAVAFGHDFVMREEKIGSDSQREYGAPLTEEAIDVCRDAAAVIAGHHALEGIDILSEELDCTYRVRDLRIPSVFAELSRLRGGIQIRSVVFQAIAVHSDALRQLVKAAVEFSKQENLPLFHTPPAGQLSETWEDAMVYAKTNWNASLKELSLPEVLPLLIREPFEGGVLVCPPYAGNVLLPALSEINGVPSLQFDAYTGGSVGIYAPVRQENANLGNDDINPLGMVHAASAVLRDRLMLEKEADCLEAAIQNVLQTGWRAGDMLTAGYPRIGTTAMVQLILEQINLVGEWMKKLSL